MSVAMKQRTSGSARSSSKSTRSATQAALSVVLVVLLALAPLPLGSNRPVFWALGALVLGISGAIYCATLAVRGQSLRMSPAWLSTAMALGAAYLFWIVLQVLPLGALTGGFETTLPSGLVVRHDTLSLTPGASILAALRVAGYGMLFFLGLQVAANRDRSKRVAQALFFMVTAWALYAMLALVQFGDTILFFEKWAYFGSATGPFVNRNSFATFLAMGLVTGLGLVADRATRAQRHASTSRAAQLTDASSMHIYLLGLMSLLVLATLFQSNSRMGVFAGLVGASLTLMLIVARRLALNRRILLLVPLALAVTGAITAWFYGGVLFERLGGVEQAADVRLAVYLQVLDMIAQRPLTGWGADSFEVMYRAFREPPVSVEFSWARAHSTYLSHWMESGVIAGSIPMILVGWAFVACLWAAIRRDSDIVLPAIGAGVILTGAVHSLVDFSLEMQANTWLFIVLIALALGRDRTKRARARTQASSAPASPISTDSTPQETPDPVAIEVPVHPPVQDLRTPSFGKPSAQARPDEAGKPSTPASSSAPANNRGKKRRKRRR